MATKTIKHGKRIARNYCKKHKAWCYYEVVYRRKHIRTGTRRKKKKSYGFMLEGGCGE